MTSLAVRETNNTAIASRVEDVLINGNLAMLQPASWRQGNEMKLENLREPFPPEDIDWRPGSTNREKTRAMALAYLNARAVMDRLDEVCGPGNWRDEYVAGPQGGVICRLSIRVDGEWVAKEDGAENTDVEAVKGGISDALKRAAVKWGVGRYLYNLPSQWVECEAFGNSVRLKERPKLPPWALPHASAPRPAAASFTPEEERAAPAEMVNTETGEIEASWTNAELTALLKGHGLKVGDLSAIVGPIGRDSYREVIDGWLAENPDKSLASLIGMAAVEHQAPFE